jgi:ATP-binding cassette subfamily F protein 3
MSVSFKARLCTQSLTGKTTFLRALAARDIKGLPSNCQVLHVEQEVVGDDTTVLEAVLECDPERSDLLREEAELMAKLNMVSTGGEVGGFFGGGARGGDPTRRREEYKG